MCITFYICPKLHQNVKNNINPIKLAINKLYNYYGSGLGLGKGRRRKRL